jgi:glycosyltransferase involved in cell wall biosynthesis
MKRKIPSRSVCMPVYSYYPFDPRVRRAAGVLMDMGYSVDVICLRSEGEKKIDSHEGVNIYRIPLVHIRGGYFRYLYNYIMFFLLSFLMLNMLDRKKNYEVVHAHSLPDFLVLIAVFQKLRKKKIVLELHEVMPEIFAARFNKDMDSGIVKIPMLLERVSIAFSSRIITVNSTIKKLYMSRGVPAEKITVIMNSPDEKIHSEKDLNDFKAKLKLDEKYVLVYVGGINPERNIEVILKAMAKVKPDIPNIFFLLFGHTLGQKGEEYKDQLKSMIKQLGLENMVYVGGRLNPEDVRSYLNLADFGVVSYVCNPLTDVAVPNKIFEYIALNKPVITVKLNALYSLFCNDSALYYEPEDAEDLARQILWLHTHKDELAGMADKACKIYDDCKWEVMSERLQKMYNEMC